MIGVDDDKWGQALKAFVVKRGSVNEKALQKHVKDNLAGYKVPQAVVFVDELPRNAAGKVIKRELEERAGCRAGTTATAGVEPTRRCQTSRLVARRSSG